jgi:hypothetical protein
VKNGGDQPLVISQVKPGCACTKVDMKKKELAPGEATEMTGTLATHGAEGLMDKSIVIGSNDPAQPVAVAVLQIRFPMTGHGLRLRWLELGARLRDDALWATIIVENCEVDAPIKIEAMELPPGWDTYAPLPVSVPPETEQGILLTRKLEPKADPEPFDKTPFVVVTDSPKSPRLQGYLVYRRTPVVPKTPPAPEKAPEKPAAPAADAK